MKHAAIAAALWLAAGASPVPASEKDSSPLPGQRLRIAADICIYGGTAGGVAAAVQARRMGKDAVVVEPGRHLGGLTSGGLGATDVGNRGAIGGISRDFYRRVREHYLRLYGPDSPQLRDCHDGFRFEPHVAETTLNQMAADADVPVFFERRLQSVKNERGLIRQIVTEDGSVFTARVFIDASYEGDLMARAGVSYTVGREANATYGETLNGVQFGHPHHNFKVAIDPYVVEGDPASGLLQGISDEPAGVQGQADHRVQAYNFRMCLTRDPANRIPFPKPEGYDPERYTLMARYLRAGVWDALRLSTPMPNGKTDTNNHGGFSTDNIGRNYDYPNGDAAARERIFHEHVTYQQGLLWFLCHDERVPEAIRKEVSQWGLAADEFRETGGWPWQLYVREARRMLSDYVMTEHDCRGKRKAADSVGLASYTMDSHHCRRLVKDGRVLNEGDVEIGGFPPYPISYRAIVPRERECRNLLVPVCLSTSHIAYGSIRMEPVFMVLGQSAATAASLALDHGVPVQGVDVAELRARLLADGQILEWTGGPVHESTTEAPLVSPKSLPGIVLDDRDARKQGEWIASTIAHSRRVGTGYVHDGNADKGKASLVYTPEIPEEGEYEVILISPPNPNRATNAPVTVAVEGGESKVIRVNQRDEAADGFASLGRFRLPSGKRTTVTLSNEGTDGYVVADGVQFLLRALSRGSGE